jgi:hypothetical protein
MGKIGDWRFGLGGGMLILKQGRLVAFRYVYVTRQSRDSNPIRSNHVPTSLFHLPQAPYRCKPEAGQMKQASLAQTLLHKY